MIHCSIIYVPCIMTSYNTVRSVKELLQSHKSSPPSFTVKLYPDYWILNNGSKCLYNNPVASLLDDIRAQRIPVDFLEAFDAANVPFYDGCMIVELQDFRSPKATDATLDEPDRSRVVLSPNMETLWADICLLNQKSGKAWTDQQSLEVEARILLATSPPLCLDPDPHLARIANNVHRASVPPQPRALKRKAAAVEQEDEEVERARRAKLAQYMNPKFARPAVTAPNFQRLDIMQKFRQNKLKSATNPSQPSQGPAQPSGPIALQYQIGVPVAPAPVATAAPVQPQYPPVTAVPTAVSAGTATPAPPSTPAPTIIAVPHAAPGTGVQRNGQNPTGQSPVLSRTSATPGVPHAPLPIPHHLQPRHPAQNGLQTPARFSQSPHSPSNTGSAAASSPPKPDTRPSSTVQSFHAQQPTQPAQVPAQAAVANAQQAHPTVTFQPQVPVANFATQAAIRQKRQPQAGAPANGAPASTYPQAGQAIPLQAQAQNPAYFYQYAHLQQQQRQNAAQQQLGQIQAANPSPAARSPAAVAPPGATQQRSSPLASTQRLTSRSPMPPTVSQAQTVHNPQQPYNYPALQTQFNSSPLHVHGHPPIMPPQLPNTGPQAGATGAQQQGQMASQDQAQAVHMVPPHYQMYYQMQHGRMPPMGYWPTMGMGRGTPVANGQHQTPAIAGHPQQMQMGANKTGGVQGS